MGKGKQQQQQSPGSKDNEDDGDELAGSTLEDYFATHKVSGQVSQHLLNIPAQNNVMAAEKADKEAEGSERQSEQENYEDDYESEPSSPKPNPPSDVAGMSLSDYLHVKEDDGAQEKLSRAGSLRVLAPQLAKKPAPISDVSGMSLDHYLGASQSQENGHTAAEKKPSPKVKRAGSKSKQSFPQAKQPFSVKGSGIIHGAHPNSSTHNVSSDDEETPFQRRQRRKDKAKLKQQRNAGSGSSVSKAILMAEAPTGQSVRDREKRKSSLAAHHPGHHGSHSSASTFQPPLPKLGGSPSVHNLSHKDHDVDKPDKLPPL
ncbi:hypothetical protein GN244_ATG08674 [Phytophthora infestans]|uniref:Uncharacterized protein n=1 Tax=Phytophthora infestans TaxID=4787 RepID=A0A833SCK5_PHYIN|nr:hypothetical protein GN244_ATG08674 [Phytophthora infestans]KAF4138392.1 hypothetical protein GN958_ATG12414 [Phytophthora infestans]KAI9994164.1 hypothetical protein PInf_016729 [Phytophthora infestans]